MSRRSYWEENRTAYLKIAFQADDTACDVSRESDDTYTVTVNLKNTLFDGLADEATVTAAIDLLGNAFDCDDEPSEIGYVEEAGWYEAPTICWSDPSCSDPGDGDTTSARLTVDADEDTVGSFFDYFTEAIEDWESDEQKAAVLAFYEKMKPVFVAAVLEALNKLDGDDVLD